MAARYEVTDGEWAWLVSVVAELRRARGRLGWTLDRTVALAGVGKSSLCLWETSRAMVLTSSLVAWAGALRYELVLADGAGVIHREEGAARDGLGKEAAVVAELIAVLTARRLECNLTQAQVAALMGVKKLTVSGWETGRGGVKAHFLVRWANVLGLVVRLEPVIEVHGGR